MAEHLNLKIKTKYNNLEAAKSCVDKIGRSQFFVNGSGQLYGEFENYEFTITSSSKTSGSYEFTGTFIEESDSIWMQGSIKKRDDIMKRHKVMFIMNYIFALILLLTMNPVFMMMAVLFLIVPIINKRVVDKSNAFYKAILKRIE